MGSGGTLRGRRLDHPAGLRCGHLDPDEAGSDMSETTKTPNYNLIKPNVNADSDLWGDHWNTNADTLDGLIHSIDTRAYVLKSGDTMAGPLALAGVSTAPVPAPGTNTTQVATTSFVQSTVAASATAPSNAAPGMDGTAAPGVATAFSRGDHIHPTDTSRYAASNPSGFQTAAQVTTALAPYAPLAAPVFTGDARAVTAAPGDSDTSIATTAFVAAAVAALPAYAPLVSPALSGNPTSVTPTVGDNDTSIATTAFVTTALVPYALLASPAFGGNPTAPTPTAGDNDTSIATTAFVSAAVGTALHNVGRNLIHNPLFNVAQRGAGPWTTAGIWTLDRWFIYPIGSAQSVTQQIVTDADRAAIGDEAA
ncbi:MAG TPA: hypothetical protein VGH84_14450, partial [Steroidobacteraceae bacterium]